MKILMIFSYLFFALLAVTFCGIMIVLPMAYISTVGWSLSSVVGSVAIVWIMWALQEACMDCSDHFYAKSF